MTAPALRPLTRALVEARLPELLALDADTPGERWDAGHWAAELPGKWERSCVALLDGRVIAVLVASRRDDALHVHRVVVAPEARGRGVGQALLRATAGAALAEGRPALTLKVRADNGGARRLYERLGLAVVGAAGDVLHMRGPSTVVAGASDDAPATTAPPSPSPP